MATSEMAADCEQYPVQTGKGGRVILKHAITIGAAGAVSSEVVDDGHCAATYSTTGTYTLTFPAANNGAIFFSIQSASATVTHAYLTAASFSGGTATFVTSSVSAPADPASGNIITILYVLDSAVI